MDCIPFAETDLQYLSESRAWTLFSHAHLTCRRVPEVALNIASPPGTQVSLVQNERLFNYRKSSIDPRGGLFISKAFEGAAW